MTRTARLLRELVALPSVNPDFMPAGDPRTGESRVADFLAALAAKAGLDVEFQEITRERANLLIVLRPKGKVVRRVLLAPHMDTVPHASVAQLTPYIKDGRLYGRGACDTKGCIAAMMTAMMELAAARKRPQQTEIVFVAFVDEECGQTGSRAFAASGLKADLAIVGEPTRLEVITAHKGDIWLKLSTQGKAAHGACPDKGRNAVHAMARVVDVLETEYAQMLRARSHPLLGHPTINVGTIQGGTQPNIVPASCTIIIDRRTLPGESESAVRKEILGLLGQHGLKVALANRKAAPCLAMATDPGLPMVRRFMQAAGKTTTRGVHFFCDASVLSRAGIPSIVFGPGDIAQAHTAEEWISLAQLEQGARIYRRFLDTLE